VLIQTIARDLLGAAGCQAIKSRRRTEPRRGEGLAPGAKPADRLNVQGALALERHGLI